MCCKKYDYKSWSMTKKIEVWQKKKKTMDFDRNGWYSDRNIQGFYPNVGECKQNIQDFNGNCRDSTEMIEIQDFDRNIGECDWNIQNYLNVRDFDLNFSDFNRDFGYFNLTIRFRPNYWRFWPTCSRFRSTYLQFRPKCSRLLPK